VDEPPGREGHEDHGEEEEQTGGSLETKSDTPELVVEGVDGLGQDGVDDVGGGDTDGDLEK
ncbi:hypothetical protein HDU93_006616, partial [Gonapodya sp. JEL0774]